MIRTVGERTVGTRRAFEGRLISVRVDEVELADGRPARREVVEHPGAVAILAWDGQRLAMVRQWRQPAADDLLEIPAGTLDPEEAPLAAARRELGEECGLGATTWEEGPSFWTAPGFCTERITVFLATDLHPAEASAPDDEVLERSWLDLPAAVSAIEHGEIADAKSIVGILWLARRMGAAAG
jgi:ADP-ribose pyrophosphatase